MAEPFQRADDRPKQAFLAALRAHLRTDVPLRTAAIYLHWAEALLDYGGGAELAGAAEAEAFLRALAARPCITPTALEQARLALTYLYRELLGVELAGLQAIRRTPKRHAAGTLPTPAEVARLLDAVAAPCRLPAQLLYGSGLRVAECLNLRVNDLDLAAGQLAVRDHRGAIARVAPLPRAVHAGLAAHLTTLDQWYAERCVDEPERPAGSGGPGATGAALQRLFPPMQQQDEPHKPGDPPGLAENDLLQAVRAAARTVLPRRSIGAHTLRHCFAAHLAVRGCDPRVIQEMLGVSAQQPLAAWPAAPLPGLVSPLDE